MLSMMEAIKGFHVGYRLKKPQPRKDLSESFTRMGWS